MDRPRDGGAVHTVEDGEGRVRELETQDHQGHDHTVGEDQLMAGTTALGTQPLMPSALTKETLPEPDTSGSPLRHARGARSAQEQPEYPRCGRCHGLRAVMAVSAQQLGGWWPVGCTWDALIQPCA